MVTSTPPLSGASGQNGGGFQPPSSAQLLGVPVANPNPGMPYQLQFLMALQQQQQRGLPANVLNQIMALKHLFYPQGFQSSQTRQDHGAAGSMVGSYDSMLYLKLIEIQTLAQQPRSQRAQCSFCLPTRLNSSVKLRLIA